MNANNLCFKTGKKTPKTKESMQENKCVCVCVCTPSILMITTLLSLNFRSLHISICTLSSFAVWGGIDWESSRGVFVFYIENRAMGAGSWSMLLITLITNILKYLKIWSAPEVALPGVCSACCCLFFQFYTCTFVFLEKDLALLFPKKYLSTWPKKPLGVCVCNLKNIFFSILGHCGRYLVSEICDTITHPKERIEGHFVV